MAVDLIFTRAPHAGGPVDLLFGATTGPALVPITVTGTGVLGGPVGSGAVQIVPHPVAVAGVGALGGVSGYGVVAYDNRNPRRASTIAHAPHQVAARALGATAGTWGNTRRELGQTASAWAPAAPTVAEPRAAWITAARIERGDVVAWAQAQARAVHAAAVHQSAARRASAQATPWGIGAPVAGQSALTHQSGQPVRAAALAPWLTSATPAQALAVARFGIGSPRAAGLLALWQTGQPLPPGMELWPPSGPGVTTPRVPSTHLLFACSPAWLGSGPVPLLFGRVCGGGVPVEPGATAVVPIRSVYMIVNTASLRRVSNNQSLPTYNTSLSIDADSWTWGFQASMPADALSLIQRISPADPVEVELTLNGHAYRALIESASRSRTFGSWTLSVRGRGLGAVLDAPYAPQRVFSNTVSRTAQQLMADALTINGEPIGWTVDWGITDWLVPANAWNHQGTMMSAVNAIAAAAGAYLQPHATQQVLRVLPRYPSAPWSWGSVVPDIQMPADVVSVEGVEWVDRPAYNRVFVSGVQQGVNAQVTRTGSAGDLLAPMVTDALITDATAGGQRGLYELSKGGQWAEMNLKLPLLTETGVITPGKFVRYNDGALDRLGIVRSLNLQDDGTEIWQTIGVESYVA